MKKISNKTDLTFKKSLNKFFKEEKKSIEYKSEKVKMMMRGV